jgi:hypothetical protein
VIDDAQFDALPAFKALVPDECPVWQDDGRKTGLDGIVYYLIIRAASEQEMIRVVFHHGRESPVV